jgi:predicted transcriptional regulator
LKHLPEPEQNEITVTELCKRIGCEKQTARAALNRLYEQGLIDRRLVGGLYIYRRKNETKE